MNKTVGSTLLVAGTMIGAGMLAMPLTSAGIGLTATVFLLIGLWSVLTFTALFISWNCIKPLTVMQGSAHLLHNILVKQGELFPLLF